MKSSKRLTNLSPDRSSKKRSKVQSNTLLNYFESSKPKSEPEPEIKQTSLLSYFTSTKIIKKEEIKVDLNEKKDSNLSLFIEKQELKIEQEDLVVKYEPEQVEETTKTLNRKCPFYKRIEGTRIVVDAFSYGDVENCDCYFLSHYHYDHFVGLNKHFKHNLYCSKITSNLVLKQIKVDKKYVHGLEMNKFLNIYENDDSIQVALIDANHCPGSVMFLFRFKRTGKYVLHTGDFRASDELVENLLFKNVRIDTIHLDTTYCDSYYTFLPQHKIISLGVEVVKKELEKRSNILIVCGSYTIGKERIFMAIGEELDLKVCVTREKMNVINCLENEKLSKMATLNPNETNLHVISMGLLNIKDLENYLAKYPSYEYLIAIKPTGWTHKESGVSDDLSVEKKSKNVIIYGLEYSEHSSFDELKNCIQKLKPRKIIPHVNVAKKETRDKMNSYFKEWLCK